MRWQFIFRFAFRELKANKRKTISFILSIFLGIAGLVAVNSFSDNLKTSVILQSKSLKGSDISLTSNFPFDSLTTFLSDSLVNIGMQRSTQTQFLSMVMNTKNKNVRLIQAIAMSGDFPFYGESVTEPNNAWKTFQASGTAVIDDALRYQLNIEINDSIKIGELTLPVSGFVKKIPGNNSMGFAGGFAAKVYFPEKYLTRTNLIKQGSRVTYQHDFKSFEQQDIIALQDSLINRFKKSNITVGSYLLKEQQLSTAIESVGNFLGLISFISLLLGGIGVASSINVLIRSKVDTIAVVRCLGATGKEVLFSYLILCLSIGSIGIFLGVIFGVLIQYAIPLAFSDLLPFDVSVSVSIRAIIEAIVTGFIIIIIFSIFPLVRVNYVSPLNTLRRDTPSNNLTQSLLLPYSILSVIFLFTLAYLAVSQSGQLQIGIFFSLAILTTLGVLFFVAWLFVKLLKTLRINSIPYIIRQGISNLFRPNNQTLTLVLTLGFGVFSISTILQVQKNLLDEFSFGDSENRPNMILFDVQKSQREKLDSLLLAENISHTPLYPLIQTRVLGVNGKNPFSKSDSSSSFRRGQEVRATYKWNLANTESVVQGNWFDPKVNSSHEEASLDEQFAKSYKAKIGDTLNVEVSGIKKDIIVTSVRKVNWMGFNPNFRLVFKPGWLDSAPQTIMAAVQIPEQQQRINFQKQVVKFFPNIMVIDISLVIQTIYTVLDTVNMIIEFIGLFATLTGLIVIIGAVSNGRFQRIRESALLRTLGAVKFKIQSIFTVEFLSLGLVAAITGISLSIISSWLLIEKLFKLTFRLNLTLYAIIFFATLILMFVLGWLLNSTILKKKPLEVLRDE